MLGGTTGYFVGTPEYASPEQALGVSGKELDGRSDLYSLGLVLYQMLKGRLPFRSDTPMAVLVQRLQSEPLPPGRLRPDLPQAAGDVAMRVLQRERENRYDTASAMERACQEALLEIIRGREDAIRREEDAKAKWAAEVQKVQRREEMLRRVAERLRSLVRNPLVLLRKRPTLKAPLRSALWVTAFAFSVMAISSFLVFTHFYAKYSRLIDQKLRAGVFANTAKIFAAPETVAVGDVATPAEIAAELRRSWYNDSRGNSVGYYSVHPNFIEIFPGKDSYFDQEPGVIRFAGGKISQIVSLQDNTARNQYQLEPQLITALPDPSGEKRRIVKFHDIPVVLVNALTSVEDKHFFQHSGFEPTRIIRAAYLNLKKRSKNQSASTLSQQLARMLWLGQEKGTMSKAAEVIITLQIEQKLSKEEIFEDYSNQIYLGSRGTFRIHGFGEAAEAFLGKDISQITLPEAAELASLTRWPANFDPFRHPDRLKERRNLVLGLMRQNGYVVDRDYALAIESPLTVAKGTAQSGEAPYFVDVINDELQNRFFGAWEELPTCAFQN